MINILSLCDSSSGVTVIFFLKVVATIITLVVPIILIVVCMLDAVKGVTTGELKMLSLWAKRSVAALIIFLIPSVVFLIANFIDPGNDVEYCYKSASLAKAKELKETEKAQEEAKMAKWKQEQEQKRKEEEEKRQKMKEEERQKKRARKNQAPAYDTGYEANGNNTTTTKTAKVDVTDLGCPVTYAGIPKKYLVFNVSVTSEVHSVMKDWCSTFVSTHSITNGRLETAGAYVNKPGYHGRGLAVDFYNNWKYTENGKKYTPYAGQGESTWSRYKTFVCEVCGGNEDCDKNINYQLYHKYFKKIGWCWGGNWTSGYFDPMHYEKTDGGCSTTKTSRIVCN